MPFTRILTRILIILNALIWLGFAIITALDLHPALPEGNLFRWIISSLALGVSLVLTGLLFLISRGSKIAYYLLLGALLLVAILTIMDDFGIVDLIVLTVNLSAIILLYIDRKAYLQVKTDQDIK